MSLNDLVGAGLAALTSHIGAGGQKKAASFCYNVARRVKKKWPEWEDLSEREQNIWAIALWDEMEKNKETGR